MLWAIGSVPSYLSKFKFVPPGQSVNRAVLNSCSQKDAPASWQCSGRGYCRFFNTKNLQLPGPDPIAFCQCDRDYADPECGTERKSQKTAFFYSIFLGYVGADYFYLGFPLWGLAKLCTLGGAGFWWLVDIVRIASGPVYAYNFRTAADLPHWMAILIMVFLSILIGFFIAVEGYMSYRKKKRQDLALLHTTEEAAHWKSTQEAALSLEGPRYGTTYKPGYGAFVPTPVKRQYAAYGELSTLPQEADARSARNVTHGCC